MEKIYFEKNNIFSKNQKISKNFKKKVKVKIFKIIFLHDEKIFLYNF